MKNLKEYIIETYSKEKEDFFNKSLKGNYGYEDLYDWYSDLVLDFCEENPGLNHNTIDKYLKDFYNKIPTAILDDAIEIGLDPEEVAYSALCDNIKR